MKAYGIIQTLIGRACALMLAACLAPLTALAEDKQAKEPTEVQRLYDQGVALSEKGDDAGAEKLYLKASQLKGAERDEYYPSLMEQLAYYAINRGELMRATVLDLEAERHLGNVDDVEVHLNIYNDLGVIYSQRDMPDSTLYYYTKALECARKLGDRDWLALVNTNLAATYFKQQRFKEAEQFADQATKYAEGTSDPYISLTAWHIAGSTKNKVKKYDEAIALARKAWATASDNADWQLRCIPTFVGAFEDKGMRDSVAHYIAIGNRLAEREGLNALSLKGFIQCRAAIAYAHGEWKAALDDMLTVSRWAAAATPRNRLYQQIADCYSHLGRDRMAYLYMDSARMWTDTLAAKDIEGRLAEFHVKYESQEKSLQLAQLKALHARQQTWWTVGALLLLAAIVVTVMVTRHRHKLRLMRLREEARLSEAAQYVGGLEGERKRLAEELHNGVANDLLGLQLRLESSGDDTLTEALGRIRSDVRHISHGLMPPEFSKLNLDQLLRHYADQCNEEGGCEVVYDNEGGDWSTLPKATAYEVFRIAQELTANAMRHSSARHVVISMEQDGSEGLLEVADDGHGFAADVKEGGGIGLRVIQDRATLIRAQWSQESGKDGTTCRLRFSLL